MVIFTFGWVWPDHLANVLLRTASFVLAEKGNTVASVIIAIAVTLVSLIPVLWKFFRHVRRDGLRTAATTAITARTLWLSAIWAAILLWAFATVIYRDHIDLVSENQILRSRNATALRELSKKSAEITHAIQAAQMADPRVERRAMYRRRLLGIREQSLRAIRDGEDNWRQQIAGLTTERGRHPADDPNQKHWQEEIERITREGYNVVFFEPVYQNALQLLDEMKADEIGVTRAREALDAARVRIGRPQPHPSPAIVRAFIRETEVLAERLR